MGDGWGKKRRFLIIIILLIHKYSFRQIWNIFREILKLPIPAYLLAEDLLYLMSEDQIRKEGVSFLLTEKAIDYLNGVADGNLKHPAKIG